MHKCNFVLASLLSIVRIISVKVWEFSVSNQDTTHSSQPGKKKRDLCTAHYWFSWKIFIQGFVQVATSFYSVYGDFLLLLAIIFEGVLMFRLHLGLKFSWRYQLSYEILFVGQYWILGGFRLHFLNFCTVPKITVHISKL